MERLFFEPIMERSVFSLEDDDFISLNQVFNDITRHQQAKKIKTIKLIVLKNDSRPTKTLIQHHWDIFQHTNPTPN